MLAGASVGRASLAALCEEKLMVYLKSRRLWREGKLRESIRPCFNEEVRGGQGESLVGDDGPYHTRGWRSVGMIDMLGII
ncbi:hypothetical protein M3J09_013019 [Ascochyta lentis]